MPLKGRHDRPVSGQSSWERFQPWGWIIVGVLGLAALWGLWSLIVQGMGWGKWVHVTSTWITHLAQMMGVWGPFILIIALALHSIAFFFPMEIPSLTALTLYGSIQGVAIIWVGSMAAAWLSYGIGWVVGPPMWRRYAKNPRVARVAERVAELNPVALILLRWISLVPFDVLNMVFGSCKVPPLRFAWTTAVGVFVTNVALALVFHSARHFDWGLLLGVLVALGILVWISIRTARRNYPEIFSGSSQNSDPPPSI